MSIVNYTTRPCYSNRPVKQLRDTYEPMSMPLCLNELEFVIVAQSHNPSILNPDFLKRNDIVPSDWEVKDAPITTSQVSQVTFNSGIIISAQYNRLVFRESIKDFSPENLSLHEIATKYVKILSHVSYVAVGTNFKGTVKFPSKLDGDTYILEKLLRDGPWKKFGTGPDGASITISYPLGNAKLNLAIFREQTNQENNDTNIQFRGNIHRGFESATQEEGLQMTVSAFDRWQSDYKTYKDLIDNSFLCK